MQAGLVSRKPDCLQDQSKSHPTARHTGLEAPPSDGLLADNLPMIGWTFVMGVQTALEEPHSKLPGAAVILARAVDLEVSGVFRAPGGEARET